MHDERTICTVPRLTDVSRKRTVPTNRNALRSIVFDGKYATNDVTL